MQEEIAEWDRKKLVEEIGSLERRHKELVKMLARVDPQVYVSKLQRELGRLQQQNRILKSSPESGNEEQVATGNEEQGEIGVPEGGEEPDSSSEEKSKLLQETALPDSTNE